MRYIDRFELQTGSLFCNFWHLLDILLATTVILNKTTMYLQVGMRHQLAKSLYSFPDYTETMIFQGIFEQFRHHYTDICNGIKQDAAF